MHLRDSLELNRTEMKFKFSGPPNIVIQSMGEGQINDVSK